MFSTDQTYLYGGAERILVRKANYMVKQGYEVIIVTTNQRSRFPCYYLDEKVQQIDLAINYHNGLSYLHPKNSLKVISHYLRVKKLIKDLHPDVWVVCNYAFDFYFLPFLNRHVFKIKEFHNSQYTRKIKGVRKSFFQNLGGRLKVAMERTYDVLLVLNEDESHYFNSGNCIVIPNFVEIPEQQAQLEKKQVLAAGRIAPVKGFDELIKIWKQVAGDFPDWELHIYGEDYLDTKRRLMELIVNLHLENSVFIKDPVPDLGTIMKNYSLYAMTSETECFPMVLLEALSVGLPIVSYDCPNGPRNIITNGVDGVLIKNKSKEDFATALKKLMKEVALRKKMGSAAKVNAQRFAVEPVMEQWKQLLNLSYV